MTIVFVTHDIDSDPRFTQLRTHLHAQVQQAKRFDGRTAPPPSPEETAATSGT